jgi:hypothetical protein
MSSAPGVLDPREYVYGYDVRTFADNLTHTIDAANAWLVTKVQVFAGANPVQFALTPNSVISVAANGCVTLEPNGAFRDTIQINGNGALIIIEYWFQAVAGQFVAGIPITVTP